jgi:hypothetical protein
MEWSSLLVGLLVFVEPEAVAELVDELHAPGVAEGRPPVKAKVAVHQVAEAV